MKQMKKILIMLMLLLPLLTSCAVENSEIDVEKKAEAGQVDLADIELQNRIVSLNGEWEFYWNQLLPPELLDQGNLSAYVTFPSFWNKYVIDEKVLPGQGYATYRLRFKASEAGVLGIKIPKVLTAYELYINNEMVASAGRVGSSRETMNPQYLPQIAFFNVQKGENEIVLLVSNYYMTRGGLIRDIEIGSASAIQARHERKLNYSLFLFGALIIMAFYHLSLFFFKKNDRAALYFGVFCFMIAIRTLMVGEGYYYTLFQQADFVFIRKIQTILFYLSPAMIILFFRSILPEFFHEKLVDFALYAALIYSIIAFFVPLEKISYIDAVYQFWCLFLIVYTLIRLMRSGIRREKNAFLIVIGGSILMLTSMLDIFSLSGIISEQWPPAIKMIIENEDYSSTGQFIFMMTYSLVLAGKFAESLEFQRKMNSYLDEMVLSRTKALIAANEKVELHKEELERVNAELEKLSLCDPLTGLWNRRKYDQVIESEWKRGLRYHHPIALIFVDIDYFKNYNDTYGHLEGDHCLVRIAQILSSSLTRSTDMVVRFGGEEFVVLLPETDKKEALKTAQMLLEKIENEGIPHCQSLVKNCVTVSIGVSSMRPSPLSSPEKLLLEADVALYRAKNNGRNQVQTSDKGVFKKTK